MKALLQNLLIMAVIIVTSSAPTSEIQSKEKDYNRFVIDEKLFVDEFKLFTSEHEIVNMIMPLNAINFNEEEEDHNSTIFFVEANTTNGIKEFKGISILKNKQVKNILATGTDAATSKDNTKIAYIGATDGLYIYNDEESKVEKYGPITDSIINVAKVNNSDVIYILTDNHELFKVTEAGIKKELIEEVIGAKQIVLDNSDNLFFCDDKNLYVYIDGAVKKIEGLPIEPSYIKLVKPPFVIEGVPVVFDNQTYIVYANGTRDFSDFEFNVKPSAYAMEATLIQFYAYEKSIYEYNILNIIFGGLLPTMKDFFDSKTEEFAKARSNKSPRGGFRVKTTNQKYFYHHQSSSHQ